MVSHCNTSGGRERLAMFLKQRRLMDLDIYGDCYTNQTCKKEIKDDVDPHHSCKERLVLSNKFYLAFENSICNDYITEKFFHFLFHDIIPVTFGGADYSAIAPPHSYVDALQFASAKELAMYLSELDMDDSKYAEYFWWKDYYEPRDARFSPGPFCDLCRRLHNPSEPPKVYQDLTAWWQQVSDCKRLKGLRGSEGRYFVGPVPSDEYRLCSAYMGKTKKQ